MTSCRECKQYIMQLEDNVIQSSGPHFCFLIVLLPALPVDQKIIQYQRPKVRESNFLFFRQIFKKGGKYWRKLSTCVFVFNFLLLMFLVETLRHRKKVEAALLGTSKYSFAIDRPCYLDSIKKWRHPLLAVFPANSAVFWFSAVFV